MSDNGLTWITPTQFVYQDLASVLAVGSSADIGQTITFSSTFSTHAIDSTSISFTQTDGETVLRTTVINNGTMEMNYLDVATTGKRVLLDSTDGNIVIVSNDTETVSSSIYSNNRIEFLNIDSNNVLITSSSLNNDNAAFELNSHDFTTIGNRIMLDALNNSFTINSKDIGTDYEAQMSSSSVYFNDIINSISATLDTTSLVFSDSSNEPPLITSYTDTGINSTKSSFGIQNNTLINIGTNTGQANEIMIGHTGYSFADIHMRGKIYLNDSLFSGGNAGELFAGSAFTIPSTEGRNTNYVLTIIGTASPLPACIVTLPTDGMNGKYISIYK
jgi:hypothetical protein